MYTVCLIHTLTSTNQDRNFELESPTTYEICVSSERLENAKTAAVTSAVTTVSTKHMDSNEEPIASFFSAPKISNAQSIQYFSLPSTPPHQHFHL